MSEELDKKIHAAREKADKLVSPYGFKVRQEPSDVLVDGTVAWFHIEFMNGESQRRPFTCYVYLNELETSGIRFYTADDETDLDLPSDPERACKAYRLWNSQLTFDEVLKTAAE